MKLPPGLYRLCKVTLLECSEFDSKTSLWSVFAATELAPFYSTLPEAPNRSERVDSTVVHLLLKRLSDGQSALQLFLTILQDRYEPGDALHKRLGELAEAVHLEDTQYPVEQTGGSDQPNDRGIRTPDTNLQSGYQPNHSGHMSSLQRHLDTQWVELQDRYATLTNRLTALNTDLNRELDSERKLFLQDRRAVLVAEREQVVAEMEQIELQLAELGAQPADFAAQTASTIYLPPQERASLERQLAESRVNLHDIEERKAEYVLKSDIPHQLIRDERRLLTRIADLEHRLSTAVVPLDLIRNESKWRRQREDLPNTLGDASDDAGASRKRPEAGSRAGVIAGERGVTVGGDNSGPIFTGDISGSVHVEIVRLPEVIPPIKRTWLPDTAGLVGRRTELDYYLKKIEASGMAVITGMPGVGKTALATMLAKRVTTPDKIFWHSFHEGKGVEAIIWALAEFLAIQGQNLLWRMLTGALQTGGQLPPPETLLDYLLQLARGHGYVICLDDFQFVDNDPLLVHLAKRATVAVQAGELVLIVTSRRLPDFVQGDEFKPLVGLERGDARVLLRARGLVLDEDLLNTLYDRTAGNAQFLTLAVHALKSSSDPARLIDHLDKSDRIDHYLVHQVDEGLSQLEKAIMGALSALLGYPGARGVIEAILAGENVIRPLRDLVDRHLVTQTGELTARQYSLHAIVQTYYYEQFREADRRQMHLQAGRYYEHKEPNMLQAALHYERSGEVGHAADLATVHAREIVNQGQARPLQLLLERLSSQPLSPIQVVSVGITKGDVYRLLGQADLARKNYQAAFDQLSTLPEGSDRTALRAKACVGMADMLQYSAPAEAVEWIEKGLRNGGDAHWSETAALYVKLSGAYFSLTNYAMALDAAERARQILGDAPSPLLAQLLINLGNLSAARGDLTQASEYTKQSLAVSQELGDFYGMLSALSNGGVDKFMAGDTAGAITDLQEALVLAQNLGSLRAQARLQVNLGIAYVRTGADNRAAEALDRGVELAHQSDALEYVIAGLLGRAELQTRRGPLESAESALGEAEVLAQRMQALDQLIEIWRRWAEIHLVRNDLVLARSRAQQALDLAKRCELTAEEGMCLRVMGQVLWAAGDHDGALASFAGSLTLLDGRDTYEAACTRMAWGSALLSSTSPDYGRMLLQEARVVFEATGAHPRLMAVAEILDEW